MHPDEKSPNCGRPMPEADWICQQELAQLLNISARTAANWAAAGKLELFAHRFPACGHRKYSRQLVERAIQQRWNAAILRQDGLLGGEIAASDAGSKFKSGSEGAP